MQGSTAGLVRFNPLKPYWVKFSAQKKTIIK